MHTFRRQVPTTLQDLGTARSVPGSMRYDHSDTIDQLDGDPAQVRPPAPSLRGARVPAGQCPAPDRPGLHRRPEGRAGGPSRFGRWPSAPAWTCWSSARHWCWPRVSRCHGCLQGSVSRSDPVLADIKIVDGARKYVALAAAGYGAHFVTVCGVARMPRSARRSPVAPRPASGRASISSTRRSGQRARDAADMGAGPRLPALRRRPRAADPGADRTLEMIPLVREVVNVPVGIVTFETSVAVASIEAGADIVLVGHPYLPARTPRRC